MLAGASLAQEPPHLIPETIRSVKPDLTGIERLRFLTTVDFKPFNYLDNSGRLTGYNINLAYAICRELKLTHICEIEAVPWDELNQSLKNGRGEAIIAGLVPDEHSRKDFLFSHNYFRLPARFVSLKSNINLKIDSQTLQSKSVGVIADSSHAYLLMQSYPKLQVKLYKDRNDALEALTAGKIDMFFDDAVSLANWLTSSKAADCCVFIGNAYIAPNILTNALSITVGNSNPALLNAINGALANIERKGELEELYLRYFPIGLY